MKKITIIVSKYSVSGVSMAQIRLANSLRNQGYFVQLVFLNGSDIKSELHLKGVELIKYSYQKTSHAFFKLLRMFAKGRYDLVISSEDQLNVIVYFALKLSRCNSKLAISSRVSPTLFGHFSNRVFTKGWLMKMLMGVVSSRVELHSCVSNGLSEEYQRELLNENIRTVYNIVDCDETRDALSFDIDQGDDFVKCGSQYVLMSIGRLSPEKGFHYALDVISKLKGKIDFKYYIIGEGVDELSLKNKVAQLDLNDYVVFLGHKNNPIRYLRYANVYIMTSQIESLGNVLVEGIIAGCTPVAFDCPHGPKDILRGGIHGGLVPLNNIDRMVDAILSALESPLSSNQAEKLLDPFTSKSVISNYIELMK